MKHLEKIDALLLITFFVLASFPLLYVVRVLDDNTLTSWRRVFETVGMGRTFLFIALGALLSFFLASTSFPERRPSVFLFCLSFLAVLPVWREPEVILDAARYFLQAKHLELFGIQYFFREWGNEIHAWTDLPLVPFLFGLLFRFFGEARLCIQLFTTFLFSLSVVLTCFIGKRLWDKETGFYGGLLLLGIPYLVTQVPLMLADVPALFFLTLSLAAFLQAVEKGGPLWIAASAFTIVLALFSKYSLWLALAVLVITSVVHARRAGRATFYRFGMVLMAAGLFSAAVVFARHDIFLDQISMLRTYQWSGLKRWQEGYASTFLFQVHPGITILALGAVFIAIKNKDMRFLIPGWFAFFVGVLQIERIRYMLPLFPLLTLMAAYGLRPIVDPTVKRFIGYSIVASSLALVMSAYVPFLQQTTMVNLRDAGRYLDTLPGETVEVRVLPQRESSGNTEMAIPILDLFTRKRLLYRQDRRALPDRDKINRSSLRFSWEFGPPRYYDYDEDRAAPCHPLVVISSEATNAPPLERACSKKQLTMLQRFVSDTGGFRYRTQVTVFGEKSLSRIAQ